MDSSICVAVLILMYSTVNSVVFRDIVKIDAWPFLKIRPYTKTIVCLCPYICRGIVTYCIPEFEGFLLTVFHLSDETSGQKMWQGDFMVPSVIGFFFPCYHLTYTPDTFLEDIP